MYRKGIKRPWLPVLAIATALLTALTVGAVAASSHEAAGNLPGGTSIEVTIDDPESSTQFLVAPGDTADVTVSGTAAVGEGPVIQDTTIAYVLDISGSMTISAGVDCTGDAVIDSRMVCQQEAIKQTNAAAAAADSPVDLSGVASYQTSGTAHDVDLGVAGTQLLVAPAYDGNSNGTPDIDDVVDGLAPVGATCYVCGLNQSLNIINDASNTNAVDTVIFTSDGGNNSGAHVNTLTGAFPASATIHAFAIGAGVSCATDLGLGSMDDVAGLTPGGTCTEVTDMSELANVIGEAVAGSSLDSLELSVDGGAPTPIGNADISAPLPAEGPVNVTYSTQASGLAPGDHELCVTATGTDAGGSDSVTACVTIHVIVEVEIDIKPNSDPSSYGCRSRGNIPVAVLSTEGFDATTIDSDSVLFGETGTETGEVHGRLHTEDVNGDGLTDAVFHFSFTETGFDCDDIPDGQKSVTLDGVLTGMTTGGIPFQGTSDITLR